MGDVLYICESCRKKLASHEARWDDDKYRVCGSCAHEGKSRGAEVIKL